MSQQSLERHCSKNENYFHSEVHLLWTSPLCFSLLSLWMLLSKEVSGGAIVVRGGTTGTLGVRAGAWVVVVVER